MGHIASLMQETSARLLSGDLHPSQSSIQKEDTDILSLVDGNRLICPNDRRALIIDEKYLRRDKSL